MCVCERERGKEGGREEGRERKRRERVGQLKERKNEKGRKEEEGKI